jgi:hypothetical protein
VTGISLERLHGVEALRLHFKDEPHVLHVRLRPSLLVIWPTTAGESIDG